VWANKNPPVATQILKKIYLYLGAGLGVSYSLSLAASWPMDTNSVRKRKHSFDSKLARDGSCKSVTPAIKQICAMRTSACSYEAMNLYSIADPTRTLLF
jgi:hypothetical protein